MDVLRMFFLAYDYVNFGQIFWVYFGLSDKDIFSDIFRLNFVLLCKDVSSDVQMSSLRSWFLPSVWVESSSLKYVNGMFQCNCWKNIHEGQCLNSCLLPPMDVLRTFFPVYDYVNFWQIFWVYFGISDLDVFFFGYLLVISWAFVRMFLQMFWWFYFGDFLLPCF